jgi:hypothetical protein
MHSSKNFSNIHNTKNICHSERSGESLLLLHAIKLRNTPATPVTLAKFDTPKRIPRAHPPQPAPATRLLCAAFQSSTRRFPFAADAATAPKLTPRHIA